MNDALTEEIFYRKLQRALRIHWRPRIRKYESAVMGLMVKIGDGDGAIMSRVVQFMGDHIPPNEPDDNMFGRRIHMVTSQHRPPPKLVSPWWFAFVIGVVVIGHAQLK